MLRIRLFSRSCGSNEVIRSKNDVKNLISTCPDIITLVYKLIMVPFYCAVPRLETVENELFSFALHLRFFLHSVITNNRERGCFVSISLISFEFKVE